jgi:hypothetical protein
MRSLCIPEEFVDLDQESSVAQSCWSAGFSRHCCLKFAQLSPHLTCRLKPALHGPTVKIATLNHKTLANLTRLHGSPGIFRGE